VAGDDLAFAGFAPAPENGADQMGGNAVSRRAVFLDRDGVLNACLVRNGRPFPPKKVKEVVLLPGVAEAIRQLAEAGFLLVGASNQPDVSAGTLRRETVEAINHDLLARLPGIREILVCFEADDACPRRKPNPGMLLEAAEKYGIDLAASFMIGDRAKDIEAGRRAGCRTIFLDHGYAEKKPNPPADYTTGSMQEAAQWILEQRLSERTP
jgi:D-glycero-D-manno-heptose 1,7-bisphosphate phosphatase